MGKVLKWIGIILGGLILLIVVAAVALYVVGSSKVNKRNEVGEAFTAPTSAEAIARGEYLVHNTSGCFDCHGEGGMGQYFFQNEMPFGTLAAPNLTSGRGGVGSMSDALWERAVRHGVGSDGRNLIIMPSHNFNHMSDEDLGAVIAYIKSVPPIDNELEARQLAVPAYLLFAAGMAGELPVDLIDHSAAHAATMAHGDNAEYGKYVTHLAGCSDCHGPALDGVVTAGGPPAAVPPPDLTLSGEVGQWTQEQFVNTIRTGLTPSGHQLSQDMPWMLYKGMVDEDLQAIYTYLHTLP
jgi:mono/diheme cytochrome c family protein